MAIKTDQKKKREQTGERAISKKKKKRKETSIKRESNEENQKLRKFLVLLLTKLAHGIIINEAGTEHADETQTGRRNVEKSVLKDIRKNFKRMNSFSYYPMKGCS